MRDRETSERETTKMMSCYLNGSPVNCPVSGSDYEWFYALLIVFAFFVSTIITALWAYPKYSVYASRLRGKADLAEAEFESRVRVTKALAEQDAATYEAEADVIRAKGIAASIAEVEDKLGGPEGYLRWKYIHMLEENAAVESVIYVPTEAGLPLLEAGRRVVGKETS